MARSPHPLVWTLLYIPFGALSGFVGALTFFGTEKGLSITESSFLIGAQMAISWMKWVWAPVVDITMSPKRWYVLSTVGTALGAFALAAIPMGPQSLWLLSATVAIASLINSAVGMAIEAMMAASTKREEQGSVSAWFQAGNVGAGPAIGGGLGMFLLGNAPAPWMAGAVIGAIFLACTGALLLLPDTQSHAHAAGVRQAVRGVFADLGTLAQAMGGRLSALICFLPIGTGAAQGVLQQAKVAEVWGAGQTTVALTQGVMAGFVQAAGCFAAGWFCTRFHPRTAYAGIGLAMAGCAGGMALSPGTVTMYVAWNMLYSFTIGMAYAAFTAVVLDAIGSTVAATKYSLYASLSNFPIWWLGLLLARVADDYDAASMLLTEAAISGLGVAAFVWASRRFGTTALPAPSAG